MIEFVVCKRMTKSSSIFFFWRIASNQWMSIDLVIGSCFYINVIDLQSPIALRNTNLRWDFLRILFQTLFGLVLMRDTFDDFINYLKLHVFLIRLGSAAIIVQSGKMTRKSGKIPIELFFSWLEFTRYFFFACHLSCFIRDVSTHFTLLHNHTWNRFEKISDGYYFS